MSNANRLNVVLDLDQTLISAEDWDTQDFDKNKAKAKKFEFHDMDGYYIVFERPNLQSFLDYLFANFNVSVWTAASKDYALFIVDKIILKGRSGGSLSTAAASPDRHLEWIFWSYHCDLSQKKKGGSKDLGMLWDEYKLPGFNRRNTVILDDYDEVHNTQPDNCIIAAPFEFNEDGSENDTYLKKLQQSLSTMRQGKLAKGVNSSLGLV